MSKRSFALVVLDRKSRDSLQVQLARGLKELVQARVLRPNEAVPSSRELARDLQISRNTVLQAYDRLIGEGYLEPSARRGLYVSESLSERGLRRTAAHGRQQRFLFQESAGQVSGPIPFRPCQPDVRLFPLALWNRMRTRALRRHGANLLNYQSETALGFAPLRRALAVYLGESRGVKCDWRQVAITTGSQQALYLLADLLLKPSSVVSMEDPGYLGARLAWQRTGAQLDPVPVDSEGMRILPDKPVAAHLVYTTPSRQFPTGACLSLSRRLSLVQWAARAKAWIVEDDYDSEFRYSRPPLPSLQSLDNSGCAIYVGSMSKVLFPSLRIGYVVLPAALVEGFAALRSVMDDHGPAIDQATLAEFIEAGALYSQIRRCRRAYGERLQAFLESAARLGVPLSFPHIDGGMNLAGFLDSAADDRECSQALTAAHLDVRSLSEYSLQKTRPGLVFGFTAFEPKTIREALKRVARALHR